MPVKKDPSGRRSVEAEVEVPGTPEEVWRAIASGPGISSWFVPTEFETDAAGTPHTVVSHFAPDASMDSREPITVWDPPRRFAAGSPGEKPGDPAVATEWTVEAKSGGTCVVRVVHSWFAESDDWDTQFEGHEAGWAAFFRILRLYLTAFRGQPSSAFQLMGFAAAPLDAAWTMLAGPLGLASAREGERFEAGAEAPPLSGLVERIGVPAHPELLLRLDSPAPGIAHAFAMPLGPAVCVPLRIYLYGDRAAAAAAAHEPRWREWMARQFPTGAPTAAG